ncbi:MAG: hypothetical protein AAGI22_19815 [Planctomycetota bacterium]
MARILLITGVVYVVLRGLVVLALGDVFFYGEELEKGTVASALIQGVDVPYARLPFHPYEGGGFVASHLKALLFVPLGPHLLAHKVAAIGWGLGVLAAVISLASRHAGLGAGVLAALLLVLGPAHLQRQSLLHLGIHYEALLFIALVFDLGLRVAATPEGERPRPGLLAGLGLAAGFGTYFSYQVPIAVLAVIVLLAVTNWRRIFAPALVAGTLVGLLPLALMALAVGSEIVDIHGSDVGGAGGAERLFDAILVGTSGWSARIALALGVIAVAVGLKVEPPTGDRRRALLLVSGFAVLWLGFAAASSMIPPMGEAPHWVRFIRFAPFVLSLLLIVALAAGPAVGTSPTDPPGPVRVVVRVASVGLLVVGLVHSGRVVREGDLGAASANVACLTGASGVEIRGALIKIAPRLEDPSIEDVALRGAESVRAFRDLDPARPAFVAAELAAAAAHRVGGVTPDAMVARLVEVLGAPEDDLAVGIGSVVLRSIDGDVRSALSDPAFDPRYAEALGRYGHGFLSLPYALGDELAVAASTPHEEAFLRGLGRRVMRCSIVQPYWGRELVLRPDRGRARLRETALAAGASEAAVAALVAGFDGAASDFGFPRPTLE